jgi:hypothetical protein
MGVELMADLLGTAVLSCCPAATSSVTRVTRVGVPWTPGQDDEEALMTVPAELTTDVVVIGGGPAGEVAAGRVDGNELTRCDPRGYRSPSRRFRCWTGSAERR